MNSESTTHRRNFIGRMFGAAAAAGLTLSATGLLSGTTNAAGTSNFTVRATNAAGDSPDKAYTLTVTAAAVAPVITTTTLPDGTPVFLAPSKEFPLINLVITFKGGSNLDPAGKSGLAAMTASQMRLGGTASMKASDLDERLDFLATKIGISSSDWTSSASLNCLASTFDESLAIMVDMLKSPGFDASKLEVAVAEASCSMVKVL